jgi:5-methyltetrahydropteroyltriglutamate--homocysteine methyltransferase
VTGSLADPTLLRADVVGSLLRPPALLAARDDCAAGRITREALRGAEDRAVDDAVALQESAGLPVVSDGEMRRLSFQSQMAQAVDGFGAWDLDSFLWGDWHGDGDTGEWRRERPRNLGVVERLRPRRLLSLHEFDYLQQRTRRFAKITVPSPGLFANFWSPDISRHAYPTLEGFLAHVAEILRDEVAALARQGARYIQIDAPHYPLLLDPSTRSFYEARGWTMAQWLELGVELDNRVMSGAPGVIFGFHLCRGNQGGRWLVAGGYEAIAAPIFRRTSARRLLLEYDDPRSGSFEPLGTVPDDKIVVLGLVSTKRALLEDAAVLAHRIQDAARYIPLERLALSPQCGFSTSVMAGPLGPADQAAKLRLVVDTAARLWG